VTGVQTCALPISGFASLDYELKGYKASDLAKLDIIVAGSPVDELSTIVHKEKAYALGRELETKLRKLISRENFEIAIQAAIGKRIIAKERIAPYRKDVTAGLYGGDITRKRKVLEKQKKDKKKMKRIGKVSIPSEAFMSFYEIETKKAVLKSVKTKILVVDSTKFGKVKIAYFADLQEFDMVITDSEISEEYIEIIRNLGLDLYIV
jgi:hypothetical protein